ncbi:MAG: hypothetical protein ACYC27_04935 [Armatimonadota bacterium]
MKLLCFSLILGVLACTVQLSAASIPKLGLDKNNGHVFQQGSNKYVFWGVDADTWGCQALNYDMYRKHCEASFYINANFIVIPITWKMFEPQKDQYNLEAIDKFLAITREYNLKAGIIWTSMDYAAGDSSLVPEYLMADPMTYTRITGLYKNDLLCPSDPDTLARDRKAYVTLMDHLARTDKDRTVMAINLCGEINYARALENASPPEQNVRCTCAECNKLYRSRQNKVEFMTERFSYYIKDLIESAAEVYDIPTYTPVCSWAWYPGWRYAENPEIHKKIINRDNHFVCPTIAFPISGEAWIDEMNHFAPESIPGNIIFADGMDTAHDGHGGLPNALPHMELAPWYNILWYGGMGAVYWDSPARTILTDELLRTKFRKAFGPLKAMHYHLARLKSADKGKKFWWQYTETGSGQEMDGFSVKQTSSPDDFGAAFVIGRNDLAFTGTTLSGPYTFTVTRPGGFEGFSFEKGCFGETDGKWRKASDVKPVINGKEAIFTVADDSGDAHQAVIRVYKKK